MLLDICVAPLISACWKGRMERETHVKKYEQPRTWLCRKLSVVFSAPKSSTGSAHKISHMSPCVGGSRKRSIYEAHQCQLVTLKNR